MRVLVVDDQVELAAVVAGALEDRGFDVRVAHAGREALEALDAQRPDAAVVDLLLPDMLGTQVLDALSRVVPPVPSVAVSGVFHGERYRRDALEVHGATRFLEKPFSTRALVDLVSELLGVASLDEAELGEALDEPLFPGEAAPPSPPAAWPRIVEAEPRSPRSGAPRREAPAEEPSVTAALDALTEGAEPEAGSFLRPEESFDPRRLLEEGPAPGGIAPETAARARKMGIVEELVTPEARRTGPRPTPPVAVFEAPRADRPGVLEPLSLARLLTSCRRHGVSGRVEVSRGRAGLHLHVAHGDVAFASSTVPEDRLLAFAVREGRLSPADAREVEARMREGRRVGEAVLSLGLVDRAGLRRLVADHCASIVRGGIAWTEGSWRFVDEAPRQRVIDQTLPRLLRAGLKAAAEEVVEAALPDDARPRPHPDPAFDPGDPDVVGEASELLGAADGTKTVADLLALTDLPPREARARLAAWVGLEVLTLAARGPARPVAFVL